MKKLTYGLLESNVYIKRVDSQGSFVRSERERFTVNIEKDLVKPMSRFEKAFFQQNKKTSGKVVSADESRELIVRKLGDTVRETPFYIATMCAIGALISLQPLSKGIKLEYIAEAVSTENEHWLKAIDFYNELFIELTEAGAYSKNALVRANGRMALACMLTGLQVVCDLTKQVFEMHEAGRFIEATNIGNQLNKMRVDSMDVYRLLYSPEHPERADLIDAMREHESKYELRLNQDNQWVVTNKHELKYIQVVSTPEPTLNNVSVIVEDPSPSKTSQAVATNVAADAIESQDRYKEALRQSLEKQEGRRLSDAVLTENESEVVDGQDEQWIEEDTPEAPDSSGSLERVEEDDLTHGAEEVQEDEDKPSVPDPETEPEAEEVVENSSNKQQAQEYQTTRKKRVPTSAMAGAVPSGGLFRAPKNKDSVPIDITNL